MFKLFKTWKIKRELKSISYFKALNLDLDAMAKYISRHPNQSPLELVYKYEGEKLKITNEIQDDLSNLIGFLLTYEVKDDDDEFAPDDGKVTTIVLFRTITPEDFDTMTKPFTIGKVREFARTTIDSDARIINGYVASTLWKDAFNFYTMKFMLHFRQFKVPGIMELSSCEEDEYEITTIMDCNIFNGDTWEYFNEYNCPCFLGRNNVWCHIPLIKLEW